MRSPRVIEAQKAYDAARDAYLAAQAELIRRKRVLARVKASAAEGRSRAEAQRALRVAIRRSAGLATRGPLPAGLFAPHAPLRADALRDRGGSPIQTAQRETRP